MAIKCPPLLHLPWDLRRDLATEAEEDGEGITIDAKRTMELIMVVVIKVESAAAAARRHVPRATRNLLHEIITTTTIDTTIKTKMTCTITITPKKMDLQILQWL